MGDDGWTKVQRRRQRSNGWNSDFNNAMKDKASNSSSLDFQIHGTPKHYGICFANMDRWWTCISLQGKPKLKEDESKEWKWTFKKHDNARNEKSETCKRSFKDAMLGKIAKDKQDNKFNFYENTLEIKPNLQQAKRLKRCWRGKARNIHALRNIWTLLKQEGLGMWEDNPEPTGRLTWLDVEGLPAIAWDVEAVNKIGSKFGSILETDNMGLDFPISNSVGVLIHTFNMEEIATSMPIKVNKRTYQIRILEDHNRSLLIDMPLESELGTWDNISRKDNDFFGESFSKMDLNFEKAANNLNNYNSQRVESSHACVNDVGTIVIEKELRQNLVDPSPGPNPSLDEAQVPEVSKSAMGFNIKGFSSTHIGRKMSFQIMAEGFKKNGKSKIKTKSIVFGKSKTSKDLQSRLVSSLSGNSEDIKIEIGKQLGLVFENEQVEDSFESGNESKISRIKSLIRVERPVVFGIQETKLASIDAPFVNSLWGNSNVDFLYGAAIGASGGTLLLWDSFIFSKEFILSGDHYIGAISKWQGINEKIGIINIYGPQGSRQKRVLWQNILKTMGAYDIIWVLLGILMWSGFGRKG
ncbi:RNA-directed DNA polymerase, eukaryota [Tanacetum coccineum]